MPRRRFALIAALLALVALTGCGAQIDSLTITRSGTGTVDVKLTGRQATADNGRTVTGRVDVLFALRMPTGTVAPTTFTSTGDVATTFRKDDSYTSFLNESEAEDGQTWVGYLSDDVTVDGNDRIGIALDDVALPAGVRAGAARAWLGGREAPDADAATVNCGSSKTECDGDVETRSFDVAPRATITSPAADGYYGIGDTVTADYACVNVEAGGCTGTVPDGDPVNTATAGEKTFTVTAKDGSVSRTAQAIYHVLPALTVNTGDDVADGSCSDGSCSLRDAITLANATAGEELIGFALPGGGPQTIETTTPLPAITDRVVIDGRTQEGSLPNTSLDYDGAQLNVTLRGPGAGTGLEVAAAAAGSRIRGLSIVGYGTGVELHGEGSRLDGSFVGVTWDGAGDAGATGVVAGAGTLVGGTTAAERNVITADTAAIVAGGASDDDPETTVSGNIVGLSAQRGRDIGTPPATGVRVVGPAVIGGGTPPSLYELTANTNIIEATGVGVRLDHEAVVRGNVIGMDPDLNPVEPDTMTAVLAGADGSVIGAATAEGAGGNLLSAKHAVRIEGDDVRVFGNATSHPGAADPAVAAVVTDPDASGFLIRGNTFGDTFAIDVDDDGPTANDDPDADGVTNSPVITRVSSTDAQTTIVGTLDGQPNTAYALDFDYERPTDPRSQYGHLGARTVTTDADGSVAFQVTFDQGVNGLAVRAIASAGESSERSAPRTEGSKPRVTSLTTDAAAEGSPVMVHLDVAEDENDATELYFDCTGTGTFADEPDSTDESYDGSPCTYDTPGTKTIDVRLEDEEGTTDTDTTFTVADVATSATVSGASSAGEGTTEQFTYTAGPDAPETIDASCGDGAELASGPADGKFSCTFGGGSSTTVSFSATDDGDTDVATKVVAIDNDPPTVTVDGPAVAKEGETLTYTWTADDTVDDVTVTGDCGAGSTVVPVSGADAFACRFGGGVKTAAVRAIADDGTDKTTATRTVTVSNVAPVATGEAFTTPYQTAARGSVLGNDTDAGGDALTARLVAPPAHGTVALAADGSFTYTPAADYSGPDGFAYRAFDGEAESGDAVVSLAVGAAPARSSSPIVVPGFTAGGPTGVTVAGSGGVDRKGILRIKLKNANPFWLSARVRLTGTLPGTSKARQLVGKDVALTPGRTTTVRLRLDKRTRAALRGGRKLPVRAAIALHDGKGNLRRLRGAVILRTATR